MLTNALITSLIIYHQALDAEEPVALEEEEEEEEETRENEDDSATEEEDAHDVSQGDDAEPAEHEIPEDEEDKLFVSPPAKAAKKSPREFHIMLRF